MAGLGEISLPFTLGGEETSPEETSPFALRLDAAMRPWNVQGTATATFLAGYGSSYGTPVHVTFKQRLVSSMLPWGG